MKKILLLGGSEQQVNAIEVARRLGYYTVLCDYLSDNPGRCVAHKFYLVSTTDKDAVLNVARKEKINGILAFASDPAAPTAAYVAEQLDLPGNPYKAVDILCNKDKFRKFLSENGFSAPNAYAFNNIDDALQKKDVFKRPSIIKPVDSSGSKGTTVLYSFEGLKDALEFAFSFSRCHRVIVEDYIDKKHHYLIGGDIFIIDGEIVLWGLLNCHRDKDVNPLVPVGKSYPIQLVKEDIEKVKETLKNIVGKLGIKNGEMNVELVIDKYGLVWPIDIGPRAGGNMIPNLLGDIFNVDIVEMSLQAAMGDKVICTAKEPDCFFATYNLHSDKEGIYKTVIFSALLEHYIYRRVLYKKPGDRIAYFDNASKCLGIIFMKFGDRETQERIMNSMKDNINIVLSRGGKSLKVNSWQAISVFETGVAA